MTENTTVKTKITRVLESNGFIVALALISMFLSILPLIHYVLLPFDFFTTFVHEGCHAIASLLMGEEVKRIVINPDTSGYMEHAGAAGTFARAFIASAGYVGSAMVGGLLIVLSAKQNSAKSVLIGLGVILILAMVFYVRDIFTLILCGFMIAAFFLIALKTGPVFNYFFVTFLAVQTALNSIGDVLTLVKLSMGAPKSSYSLGKSDADVMAELFWLPAIVWSVLWVAFSLFILYLAMKKSGQIRAGKVNQPVNK